ncbi:GNAT family N-acetyltransferase [Haloarchaeobius amylolyticus]|uniref:GNAT family N-acetyltransferase n=1 Tax=Haloarchaeobius amylolyticus TaxID=1198296 RepID=UPI00226E3D41|nr:GNAT family protein [Haloarchaeobius amylolyticus]
MSDLFPERFETARLRFERVGLDTVDTLDVYPYYSTEAGIEQATRYMTWEPHQVPEETWEFVRAVGEQAEAGDGKLYALYPKAGEDGTEVPGAGEFAGTAGLHPDWDQRSVTFGMWLRKPFWGRGYSGERADAFVTLAFDRLDLDLVAVTVLDENDQSKRAIEKYVGRWGGQHDGYFPNLDTHGDEPASVHRYSITREQYEAADVTVDLTIHDRP